MGNPSTLGEGCNNRRGGGVGRLLADKVVERALDVALV